MRILPLMAAFFLTLADAQAQSQRIDQIEVVAQGIYVADRQDCRRDERGLSRCTFTNVRHAATTTTVPAEIGVIFGGEFRIVGGPDRASVNLRKVWIIPAPGLRSPNAAEPIRRIEREEARAIGSVFRSTFGFDDNWELVPGTWILEFWDGDRRLLSQEFTIVEP